MSRERGTLTSTNYVIDTCVLLADPNAQLRFDEHDVVLPLVVVEELDRQKSRMDEVGANRRSASKVVFCGDLTQVDNPYVSPFGGLAAMIEKFKGNSLFGHVTLDRTVRSPLAEYAAKIL